MNMRCRSTLLLSLLFFVGCAHSGDSGPERPRPSQHVRAVLDARESHTPLQPMSVVDPAFDLDDAYEVQDRLVAAMQADEMQISGWKFGFTTRTAQERWGVARPQLAPLFREFQNREGWAIPVPPGQMVLVEAEVVFEMKERIHEPVASIEDLEPLIRAVRLGIEVPLVRFSARPTAADIVADHMGTYRYLIGPRLHLESVDRDNLVARVTLDGELVSEGTPENDPLVTLLSLVNRVVARGHAVERGALMFAGSIHAPIPVTTEQGLGEYHATVLGLGSLRVRIR